MTEERLKQIEEEGRVQNLLSKASSELFAARQACEKASSNGWESAFVRISEARIAIGDAETMLARAFGRQLDIPE